MWNHKGAQIDSTRKEKYVILTPLISKLPTKLQYSKVMERCLTSFVIKEAQVKTIMRYHFT
jgi:hypothetical protein